RGLRPAPPARHDLPRLGRVSVRGRLRPLAQAFATPDADVPCDALSRPAIAAITLQRPHRPSSRDDGGKSAMKIRLTSIHVDDQAKALRFYTEVLGFVKKTDFSQGPYRWLTVASPEDPDGTELQLALNSNPAAKTYQQAILQQGQSAAMFYTDDLQADY